MDIVLNRKGGVPLHDQLLAQLELKILTGSVAPGQRLPSVRALARRLGLHANTVSAAYKELEESGHVELRRGAGVYVLAAAPSSVEEARGLDEMIRLALRAALRKGYSGSEIQTAVQRWLRAAPPERVVVVDPQAETVDIVTHELRRAVPVPVSGCTISQLQHEPGLLSGALGFVLPYHAARVARLAPGAVIEIYHIELSRKDRETALTLPAGATILFVSHSPAVLSFAAALAGGLRGDELLVETRLVSRRAEWRRLLPAADIVYADVLSIEAVRECGARRLHELRLVGDETVARVRQALNVVVPRD
jgi:DNA-binding transcriptional regulator YhcF (GntR family)